MFKSTDFYFLLVVIFLKKCIIFGSVKTDFFNDIINDEDFVIAAHTDNEYMDYYSITIDNNDGIWVCREGYNKLIMFNDKFIYTIDGNIVVGELINVYKNIENLKK